jgi:glycosyltransferase involved in cell wall biosynthesis
MAEMRFHVLGIPHTIANKEYIACAFTQLAIRFCKMLKMSKNKYTIYFYGHEKSEIECDELVKISDDALLERFHGKYDPDKLIKYGNTTFESIFNLLCIDEIKKRKKPRDFILTFWGITQKTITDQFPDCIIVEPSIGYPTGATFAPFKVFVSYAWMHFVYGRNHKDESKMWYDCVIPNFFDPSEFEYKEDKEDYMLYLGRIIQPKGLDICVDLADKLKMRLIVAGQGDLSSFRGDKIPKYVECVKSADVEVRKRLMSNAKCLLLPSYYVEPFGNVVIEALMSGTPVITADWGAFSETNLHGITGYRCRTFEQFMWAVKNIHLIKPKNCRDWAISNFSIERVKGMYEEYFNMLHKLSTSTGFYESNESRDNLDWLYKSYPNCN